MRGNKAIKTVVWIASAALFLSIPTSIVNAEKANSAEQGVAGIAAILENTTAKELEDAYKSTIELLSTKTESPYANLGVSIADNYVNIRKEPSTESEVVGRLNRGCVADILDTLPGGWVKIKSGDVEGYIAKDFLAIGDDAEEMLDKNATKWATVNYQTVRVRAEQSTDSKILTLIPLGEKYYVVNVYGEWVEIVLGTDEDTGAYFTGFVKKELVDITIVFEYAQSMEEINRKIQEEAERAEAVRKQKQAQEEAERKEAERKAQKAAEAAAAAEEEDDTPSETSGDSSSLSDLRNKIVTYALKFVGNSYVWGGESLTRGADCSGFVQAIYDDFGYHIPRVSRDQAASAGKKVKESELLPGDLIFYANSRGVVNHVAMYIGNGRIVQAANSRQGIITSQYKYRDIYCIRRIVY